MRKANPTLMKEINLNHVREVMKQLETATKPRLASMTGLSVVTINSLVKELHERGELFEDSFVPSGGGRPAQTYRYNYDFSLALVMYLKEEQGQELVSAAVVNLEDGILARENYKMPVLDRAYFRSIVGHFISLYPAIKIIGIGIPGQAVNGEITVSSHQELRGSRMIKEIEAEFGLQVLVENDVNAAISGYCMEHGEAEDQCISGIYFPRRYPPGMGIVLDGKVIRGKNGMSGEIKFLPDSPDWMSEMSTATFVDVVCRILQTVNAVLAPDKIVIYQDRVGEELWEPAWRLYCEHHPMPSDPEVILQNTFQQDFETGLRRMTLKGLQSNLAPTS
ncbi:ROK family protein [Paenibacillus sp. PK3_47]|uniref:ROK family protein n=1 Tax=Paenibacillus sp. PK3_47 TaxID=2072642 RepID=UPI00201DCECF|nr:ROK family protein [Paenibacillus sp. PK3_47]UQZ36834.1 ROK family protein [Paenibacillus sp. PK3_47]